MVKPPPTAIASVSSEDVKFELISDFIGSNHDFINYVFTDDEGVESYFSGFNEDSGQLIYKSDGVDRIEALRGEGFGFGGRGGCEMAAGLINDFLADRNRNGRVVGAQRDGK